MRIGLLTRCKEEPYVTEFVRYYLSQGVDHIYIIDDDSSKDIYEGIRTNQHVTIQYSNLFDNTHTVEDWREHQLDACNELYKRIKANYDWMIFVDMDEYITTRKHATHTIRDELETTFANCDCVKVPWVIMSCNSIKNNPVSLLKENIYRWNHDMRHENTVCKYIKFRCRYDSIEVKCIFKPVKFDSLTCHYPINRNDTPIRCVDSVHNQLSTVGPYYENLREKDIKEGYLLCYHYRIVSVEQCRKKISTNLHYTIYSLEDLLSFDYPELVDETMRIKSAAILS